MQYSNILRKLKDFTFVVDKNLLIKAVSANITSSKIHDNFISQSLHDIISEKFLFDDIELSKKNIDLICDNLSIQIASVFKSKEYFRTSVIKKITNNDISYNYSFTIDAQLMNGSEQNLIVRIQDFSRLGVDSEFYDKYFTYYEDEFELVKKMNQIGKFIIDYDKSKYLVYANDIIPDLLDIDRNIDHLYVLSSRHDKTKGKNTIFKSKAFYQRVDMLINGIIPILHDEWQIGEKWLKLEAKILQKNDLGVAKVIGGIIYDITDYHRYKDLEHVHSIYELAITSGGIGIFHYNLDKHDATVFEANKIYGAMLGIDPVYDDFYRVEDFLKTQLQIEDEITEYDDVKIQVSKLFKGEVSGTTDDILKIINLKTEEIRYLLSSSKIDSYNDDGSAKRFGGIIIDITDRIQKEQNQRAFAYKDELTGLGNNRLLHKDLIDKHSGIGLFFDLDNFKKINDEFGHIKGDQMIQIFGKSLSQAADLYEFVTVYRLYGDEFFVFGEFKNENFAFEFEQRANEFLNKEMENVTEVIKLEASMGHSYFEEGSNIDDFIKYADYAMYKTKIQKKK